MALHLIRNDITKVSADAIVNSANPKPICGGGTEYSIYRAAGFDRLLKAREEIGPLDIASVAVTSAFDLKAKHIIHTVGPVWNDGKSGEFLALQNCYLNALQKAKELKCKSIAFPLIASGVYRFPKDKALEIALKSIHQFLATEEMDVFLVIFDQTSFEVSKELESDVQNFIDENYVRDSRKKLYDFLIREHPGEDEKIREIVYESSVTETLKDKQQTLESFLQNSSESFQEKLFSLIREKQKDEVAVYKAANIDRKHFSKIKSHTDYRPKKKTVLAFAIALHLNMEEAQDLLARAGFAFSPSDTGDLIVNYFIQNKRYNLWEINEILFKYCNLQLGM